MAFQKGGNPHGRTDPETLEIMGEREGETDWRLKLTMCLGCVGFFSRIT